VFGLELGFARNLEFSQEAPGGLAESIEKHFLPLVRELRERARRIPETGDGLGQIAGKLREQQKPGAEKID
jgi:hypothetical protein